MVLAQAESEYRMPANKTAVEIDFLANYYAQDGSYGAPQGGRGTEELDNRAGIVVVNVPIDSNSALNATLGIDAYSSASTDRIDYQLSTASSSDVRGYANLGWTESDLGGGRTYTVRGGFSKEYDYLSFNASASVTQEWARGQHQITAGVQAFFDEWDIIVPAELRLPARQPQGLSPQRRSYGFSLTYAGILAPRVQLTLTAEPVAMSGLLSTPFHRIYFQGLDVAAYLQSDRRNFVADDVERLPDTRYKLPLSIRLNYKLSDALALRTFGRYYTDSWGVQGISLEAELAYQVSGAWTLIPFARYYEQQSARYYRGIGLHSPTQEFYTSDVDLAELNTAKLGLGIRYAPLFGLGRTKVGQRGLEWKQVSLRGAYYTRNLDLTAYSITIATSFSMPKLR